MNMPPAPGNHPDTVADRGIIDLLRDPVTIVVLVSTAMMLLVYYHGPDITFIPQWAQDTRLNWFGLNFLCLFIVPWIITKFVLKRTLADMGLRLGDWRTQLKFAAFFGIIVIPVILIASRLGDFQGYYGKYFILRNNPPLLIVFMAGWAVYFFAWEFFFRGFLLQSLGERFGPAAVALQTMPFVMMHFAKPELESFAAIIAGMALGWWGWKTRSFIGPWLLHWISSATMILSVLFWMT